MNTLEQGCEKVRALIYAAKEAATEIQAHPNFDGTVFLHLVAAIKAFETTVVPTSWCVQDVHEVAEKMGVWMNDELAGEVLESYAEYYEESEGEWDQFEKAIVRVLDGF